MYLTLVDVSNMNISKMNISNMWALRQCCFVAYDQLCIIDFKLSISLKKFGVPPLKTTLGQ